MIKRVALCKHCKKEITIKSSATDRPELQKEKGDQFEKKCPHCARKNVFHVNDVYAEPNQIYSIIGVIVFLIVTALLWQHYGAISSASGLIPIFIYRQQIASVKFFNAYRVRKNNKIEQNPAH
ncbi:MAG: hypothetical protein H6584_03465 [Flavobacteriales bacterium]|nr:hypothetical protein [Flavobacteriales bacterium]